MFKPRKIRNSTQGNDVFHLVSCRYNFQENIKWLEPYQWIVLPLLLADTGL